MKLWPIIRHIRFVYWSWRLHQWTQACTMLGLGLGHPNPADLEHLEAIWRGKR